MNDDFRDIIELLLQSRAEFVVVGAHALAVHGVSRATGDIDLFVRPSLENANRVCAALQAFGAPLASHRVGPAELAEPGMVYQLGLPPRRIDVLTEIDGVDFAAASKGCVLYELDGLTIPFLGKSELIQNKLAAGRPKDLADVAMLTEND